MTLDHGRKRLRYTGLAFLRAPYPRILILHMHSRVLRVPLLVRLRERLQSISR